jgi:DNA modification methylase
MVQKCILSIAKRQEICKDSSMIKHLQGDCREVLKTLPEKSINTCVTSPPYWGLRDYGVDGQLGMEPTPEEYVAHMVEVFAEVKKVLQDDGTLWLNLGDSYVGTGDKGDCKDPKYAEGRNGQKVALNGKVEGLKRKDLVGIPWRVAFALQSDGWYLRSDIIWHKPNPMPESVTDRPTKSHEYIFLLVKNEKYYYDHKAIMEKGSGRIPGNRNPQKGTGLKGFEIRGGLLAAQQLPQDTRNKHSVWTIPTNPYSGAHFAVFPPELIRPCILAGCPAGGTVLDPFGGSGTTAMVAEQEGRNAILIELNPDYIELQKQRTQQTSIFA